LGSAVTIHPPNKQDVGKRLALVAFEKTYGQKMESSGPRYHSMKIEGNTIRVIFTHAIGLLVKGESLKTFAIAGEDKKFFWADAKIDGATVVMSSPQVPYPVAVRYAWADNPESCNLYNSARLPASPFRTDISEKPDKTANIN
jgi:sialate O-acetylesterase